MPRVTRADAVHREVARAHVGGPANGGVGVPIGDALGHTRHELKQGIRRRGDEGEIAKLTRQDRAADSGRIRLYELRRRGHVHRLS